MKIIVLATATAFGALISANAMSQTGALEINQACVETGCFPGDNPGFPVRISQPGRYYLTSNLQTSDPDESAIQLVTDNIWLDLAGFSVIGPVYCGGEPITCSPESGSGHGIDGNALTRNSVVMNGAVRGFAQWGVATDFGWKVSNISSNRNGVLGINIRRGTIVENSSFKFNKADGVHLGCLGVLRDSVSANNGGAGVSTCAGGSTLDRNTIYNNAGPGIYEQGRAHISSNTIHGNGHAGIVSVNGGSSVLKNRIYDNAHLGLQSLGQNHFADGGLVIPMSSNYLFGNNGGNTEMPQLSGPNIILLEGNICNNAPECSIP